MTFRFVGSRAEKVGTPFVFDSFGQSVDIDMVQATELVDEGMMLIPDAEFATVSGSPDPRFAASCAFAKFKESLKRESPAVPVIPVEEEDNVNIR